MAIRGEDLNRKESLIFSATIPAGEKGEIKHRIKDNCTITRISGKFYLGQQLKLRVVPILYKSSRTPNPLVTFVKDHESKVKTNEFLSGDDKQIGPYDISFSADRDDYISVEYENTADFPCTLDIVIDIDFYGGKKRVV